MVALAAQPATRDELVVVELEESDFVGAHDTQKLVTVELEHDVDGEGSGEGSALDVGRPSGSRSSQMLGSYLNIARRS